MSNSLRQVLIPNKPIATSTNYIHILFYSYYENKKNISKFTVNAREQTVLIGHFRASKVLCKRHAWDNTSALYPRNTGEYSIIYDFIAMYIPFWTVKKWLGKAEDADNGHDSVLWKTCIGFLLVCCTISVRSNCYCLPIYFPAA